MRTQGVDQVSARKPVAKAKQPISVQRRRGAVSPVTERMKRSVSGPSQTQPSAESFTTASATSGSWDVFQTSWQPDQKGAQ